MIFTTRDLDILRLSPLVPLLQQREDFFFVFSNAEVQNLRLLHLMKYYLPARAYTLTAAGNRLLDTAFPKLPAAVAPAYKPADTIRRIRQAKLMTTAYQAGVPVLRQMFPRCANRRCFFP